MPPSVRLLHAETATASRPLLAARRTLLSNGVAKTKTPVAENFEELAFRTLQALNPKRRIKRSEVPVERVRRLLERLLSGDSSSEVLSSLQLPNRRSNSTASHSSSSSSPQANGTFKRISSPPPPLALTTRKTSAAIGSPTLPPINENYTSQPVDFEAQRRPSRPSAVHSPSFLSLKRRNSTDEQSTSESTSDETGEEPKPKSAFDLLFERALDEATAIESVRVILDELRQADTNLKDECTNTSLLVRLSAQNLQNEIDAHRTAEKNVQTVEVKILLELHKILLADKTPDWQQSKLIPTLRYLNIITGGTHLNEFVVNVLEPEFGSKLPAVLQHLRHRLRVEMPEPFKSFSPIDAADLPPAFSSPVPNGAAKQQRESVEMAEERTVFTRRRRSNASTSTLSSVTSSTGLPILDRFSAAATPMGSKRASLAEAAPLLVAEVPPLATPRLKQAVQRNDSNATISSDGNDEKPPILARAATRSIVEEAPESPKFATPKRAAKRKAAAALIKVVEESEETIEEEDEEAVETKRSRRVDGRGSIASRRQTNRRLCVIRQEVKDLILPTSRRSSTATLLQQQQPRRRSLLSRLTGQTKELVLAAPHYSTAAKKPRCGSKESNDGRLKAESSTTKPKPPSDQPLTDEILQRYAQRMSKIHESAMEMDEHEVFYGRRNGRVDLFETEIEESSGTMSTSPPETSTKSKQKVAAKTEGTKKKKSKKEKAPKFQQRQQKNRSGRSVKETSEDCLYIAHSLLNVHNRDPLASGRPRPSQLSNGAFAFGGDLKRTSADGQPFRVKRLLKHATRAKTLKLRRYLQRAQEQQLLLQNNAEKVEVE